jgi:peptide/nickel transport system permease protein
MIRFLLKRLAFLPPMLLLVSIVGFLLDRASGGDPAEISLLSKGILITPDAVKAERKILGIDGKSAFSYYLSWLGRAAKLDFGNSYQTGRPVLKEIKEKLPISVILAGMASITGLLAGIFLGVVSVRFYGGYIDSCIKILTTIGLSIPNFCLGLALLYVFGFIFKIFPTIVGTNPFNLVLPILSIVPALAAVFTVQVRLMLLEVKNKLFFIAQEAKGVSPTIALLRHGLPSVITPILTIAALNFKKMISVLIVCELVFSINGIGKFALDSMKNQDFPVMQGYLIVISILIFLITLSLDFIATVIDPRLKNEVFQ